ncbi:YmiA family putative membrane protein [Erwinia endophytica]|nr:YmiA family putative membrane protein [Erwinia endophytica]KAB8313809.1 YmiA family putative membrane protein [Erwinia endophytica]
MKNIAIQSKNIIRYNGTSHTKRKAWLMVIAGSGLTWAIIALMVWVIYFL